MSSICHGFVQNAWRKDICSNCFRLRDEHSMKNTDLNHYSSHYSTTTQQYHHHHPQQLENGVNLNGSGKMSVHSSNNNQQKQQQQQQNHSISILVKNSENSHTGSNQCKSGSGTGRYQSPTSTTGTGIPSRVGSSHSHKYQQHNGGSSKSFYSSYSNNNSGDAANSNHHGSSNLRGSKQSSHSGTRNSAEVIGGITGNGNGGSKKVVTHPFKSDKDTPHHLLTSSRLVNNALHGSSSSTSAPSSSNGPSHISPTTTNYNHNGIVNNNNNHNQSTNGNANTPYAQLNGNGTHQNQNGSSGKQSSSSSSSDADDSSSVASDCSSSVTTSTTSTTTIKTKNQSQKNKTSGVPVPNSNSTSNGETLDKHKSPAGAGTGTGNKLTKNNQSASMDRDTSSRDAPDGEVLQSQKVTMTNGQAKRTKGILKALDGKKRRKLSVKFPKEVCEVIGYGGESNWNSEASTEEEEDEDEDVPDPQDLVSIAELLANNSVTTDEKELHRITIKNTNFNSIKTNLMGYAPIEIGPIVGCTGGKSMESSSKPLVSIGTFEARKEPLKVRKVEDVDSIIMDRKIVVKPKPKPAPAPTPAPSTTQVAKTNDNDSSDNSVNSTKTKKVNINTNTTTTTSTTNSITTNGSSENKTQKSVNIIDNAAAVSVGSGNTVTNGKSNSSKLITTTSQLTTSAPSTNDVKININGKDVTGNQTPNGVSTIQVNPEKSSIKITTESLQRATTMSSTGPTIEKPKPKPILKNTNQPQDNIDGGGGGLTKNNLSVSKEADTVSLSTSTTNGREKPLSNLIILNGGNIASKRTSFLQDIISTEPTTVTVLTSQHGLNGTSIIETNDEPMSMLHLDSLEPSIHIQNHHHIHANNSMNLKTDGIKINLKLDSLKSYEIEDNTSEFDDSLEDSGLDISGRDRDRDTVSVKTVIKSKVLRIENSSESDDNDNEKFGSSSDSGNENDFHEQIVPKGGLYISVDDDHSEDGKNTENASTKAKLSPDSVLFSSASEMSASGSSESIPECVNVHVTSAAVKRPAPPPPISAMAAVAAAAAAVAASSNKSEELVYANHAEEEESPNDNNNDVEEEEEDVYDDVSCYQEERNRRLAALEQESQQHQHPYEEESLYDDCTAISSSNNHNNQTNGKSFTGSYDFTNGTRTSLDTDFSDSVDRIPLRPSDGIEFIGIRKIDSETHLNANLPPIKQRSASPEDSKRERSSSVSPKARRKVNQFFSTIGKKAGAAFSSGHHASSSFLRNKSPSPAPTPTSPVGVTGYKRSLSQDEVSMTRTQEIYATLTPTSLKFKGLAPVLQKLSRMDGDSNSGSCGSIKEDNTKEKMFKKNKIIPSLKKFLRMGNKDSDSDFGSGSNSRSYDFKTDLKNSNANVCGDSSSSIGASSESSSNPPSLDDVSGSNTNTNRNRSPSAPVNLMSTNSPVPSFASANKPGSRPIPPGGRPPPPPPRVHSLDMLNKAVGNSVAMNGPGGTVKPARPPPPVRSNRIAPSFVSVFAAHNDSNGDVLSKEPAGPPNKPKRKASMNGHSSTSTTVSPMSSYSSANIRNEVELLSLECNVTSLNFETLKLIAGQEPLKIKRKSTHLVKFSPSPLRWSHFYVSDTEPMADGDGFAFYSALWEDEPCVLLLEENSNQSAFHQLTCVEISAAFVDNVPVALVTWTADDYANGGSDVKANISVLPSCTIKQISAYISSRDHPSMQKYFALLQTLYYWGKEDMTNLLVFQGGSADEETPSDSELVYVFPVNSPRAKRSSSTSYAQLSTNFEIGIKQLLLQPHLLSPDDRQLLFRVVSGTSHEVEAQLKLFLQVKLFGRKMKSDDLDKLKRTKAERVVHQWLEKERALCMRDAIERTLQRQNEPISPLKKAFVEFLMIPDSSATALMELLLDLN